jgi:ankyrin repeat protein
MSPQTDLTFLHNGEINEKFLRPHNLDGCDVCDDNRGVNKSPFGRIKTKEKIFVPLLVLISTIWTSQLGRTQGQESTADELVKAAEFDWPEKLESLVKNHADINAQGFGGYTALAAAANRGDVKMVEFLLKHKADPNARNKDGMTPIIMARSVEVIKLLLASGADINATAGWSTLFNQIIGNRPEHDEPGLVQFLLTNGVDVTTCGDDPYSGILYFVLYSDDIKDVDLLVPYYINSPKPKGRALLEAALGTAMDNSRLKMASAIVLASIRLESHSLQKAVAIGDDATVRSLLIAHPNSINEKGVMGWTALHTAVLMNQPAIVETLLVNHADPNALDDVGHTPLSWAAFLGHSKVVAVLLQHKPNIDLTGSSPTIDGFGNAGITPLYFAIQQGFTSISAMLITNDANLGANPNGIGTSAGETPLHVAASFGNADVIKLLLAHGADVNARERWPQTSPFGISALDIAVKGDSPESVRLLIANGASLETQMDGGVTLFDLWASNGNPAIADQLLAAGCDINAKNDEGKTPLDIAITSRQKQPNRQAIQWLLDHKADVNAKAGDGSTPLHYAVHHGAEVVRLLLDHNADVNALDYKGETALGELREYAWKCSGHFRPFEYDAVVKLLLAHGAKDSPPTNGPAQITIPNGVTSIRASAFMYNDDMRSITIPPSVTSIGAHAFDSCTRLTSVTIPGTVTSIGNEAFSHCQSLTKVIISKGVVSIGQGAFSNCGNLTCVIFPTGVTSIEGSMFAFCGKLTSFSIPESVTSIEGFAFYSCDALTSVTIPASVKRIQGSAFYANNLTSVYFEGNAPPGDPASYFPNYGPVIYHRANATGFIGWWYNWKTKVYSPGPTAAAHD